MKIQADNWATRELKGEVKTIVTNCFSFLEEDGDFIKGEPYKHEELEQFNKKGNLIEKSTFLPDGSFYEKTLNIFDEFNNKIQEFGFHNPFLNWYYYEFKYDSNGYLLERSFYEKKELSQKIILEYDFENLTRETKGYRKDGYFEGIDVEKFDKNGNLIEVRSENNSTNYSTRTTFKYNDAGKKTEIKSFYHVGGGLGSITKMNYNEYGHIIEETCDYPSSPKYFSRQTFKYTYDSNQNWISKIKYENEIPKLIYERKIKYF